MGVGDLAWWRRKPEEERNAPALSFNDYLNLIEQFGYQGVRYSTQGSPQEEISPLYSQFANVAYKADSIVFACLHVRQAMFSEARFQFRQIRQGRPGDLFGTADLDILEAPWPGATTGDMLTTALMHHDLGGNAFIARSQSIPNRLAILRPDWVRIIVGSTLDEGAAVWDPDAEVVGYVYKPGGPGSEYDDVFYLADEVAHFATIKDPDCRFRGMSILTAVVKEVMADKAMTDHKLKFMENAATPNLHVKLDVPDLEQFEAYVRKFREGHEGTHNAYKTLFTAAGADATVIGADLQQLDFKIVQGAGETRIASALGVPPVLAGLSEGLQGSSLNTGNFEASMRRFFDVTMRPLWRNIAGSLARIVNVPGGAELWYDDRDIPALREDVKKAGERLVNTSTAASTLIMAGYEPDSVTAAVVSGDMGRLKHTGLPSVQLQAGAAPTKEPQASETKAGNRSYAVERLGIGDWPNANPEWSEKSGELSETLLSVAYERENARLRAELASKQSFEIHNHLPEQPAPQLSISEGAFRVETAPQQAPDVNVTVEAGEPAKVEFHEGAFRTDVAAPPPAEVNVTVEAAPAAEPARVDVKVETERLAEAVLALAEARKDEKPAEITVNTPEVRFEPQIDVHVPEQRDAIVNVSVPQQPAPVVNVTNEVQTPEVNVTLPEQPAPVVNVNIDEEPLDATVKFKRNRDGSISSAEIKENPEA